MREEEVKDCRSGEKGLSQFRGSEVGDLVLTGSVVLLLTVWRRVLLFHTLLYRLQVEEA